MAKLSDTLSLAGITGVLAALALAITGGVPRSHDAGGLPRQSSGATPATGSKTAQATRIDTADSLLRSYYGRPLTPIPGQTLAASAIPDTVEALIATVPDPIDSHVDWKFDAYLESYRRALQAAGFASDRFWLPWTYEDSATARTGGSLRSRAPGVWLFRRPKHHLLILFLVGEVPTAGIHLFAFNNAVAQVESLARPGRSAGLLFSWGRDRRPGELRVVGPSFSGSAASLRRGLDNAFGPPRRQITSARVRSGTATAPAVRDQLLDSICPGPTCHPPPIQFRATVRSDADLSRVLFDSAFTRLGILPQEVALLREGNTAYGSQKVREAGADTLAPAEIYVPSNLSSLRGDLLLGSDSGMRLGVAQSRTPLVLRDASGFTENPPMMSRNMTPAAVEEMMQEVYLTLREHRVRAVGLAFTDDRDKIFFARELRRHMPDVTLISYGANALFLRPDVNPAVRGMITVSSYPLTLETLWWRARARGEHARLLPYLLDGAEGNYNAMLRQLADSALDSLMTDYAVPTAWRRGDSIPPVWLSIVGKDRFVPLNAFLLSEAQAPFADRDARAGEDNPIDWYQPAEFLPHATWGAIVLAILLLMRVGRYRDPLSCFSHDPWQAARGTTQDRAKALGPQRALYQLALGLGSVAVILPLLLVMGAHLTANYQGLAWHGLALACLGGLLWGLARVARARAVADRLTTSPMVAALLPSRWTLETGATLTLAAATAVTTLWLVHSMVPVHTPDAPDGIGIFRAALWLNRALALDVGVSPLTPLAVVGLSLLCWCAWEIRRTALFAETTPIEQAALAVAPAIERRGKGRRLHVDPLSEAVAAIVQIRTRLSERTPRLSKGEAFLWLLLIALLVIPACVDVPLTWEDAARPAVEKGSTPEWWLHHAGITGAFDVAVRLGMIVVFGVTLCLIYRFIRVWSALRGFLHATAHTALITAFERLPQRVARLTRISLTDAGAEVVDPIITTQWAHLRRLYDKNAQDFIDFAKVEPRAAACIEAVVTGPVPGKARRAGDVWTSGHSRLRKILYLLWVLEPGAEDIRQVTPMLPPTPGKEPIYRSTSGAFRRTFSGGVRLWLRELEEFTCVNVVTYIEWVLTHLRAILRALLAAVVLMLLFVSSYPFRPETGMKLTALLLMVAAVAAVILAMVQANRDDVLSRIAKTDPGRVTWDAPFVLNACLFAIVPLLTLLATEFGPVQDLMSDWIAPLARLLGAAKG